MDMAVMTITFTEDTYLSFVNKTHELHGEDLGVLADKNPKLALKAFRECVRTIPIPNLCVTNPEGIVVSAKMDGPEAVSIALLRRINHIPPECDQLTITVQVLRRRWLGLFDGKKFHPQEPVLKLVVERPILAD